MKVILLSDSASSHTLKWVRSLSASGIEICVFGLNSCPAEIYAALPNVRVVSLDLDTQVIRAGQGSYRKLRYFYALPALKRAIKDFQPDIVHAHYATSYGLLGALCGFRPYLLSVWGSDIFLFPTASLVHRWLIQFNLKCADRLLAASQALKRETGKYTDQPVGVLPFGIDLSVFRPKEVSPPFPEGAVVVGTVKTLEAVYGIDYLIRAFGKVRSKHPQLPLKLLIVGGGSQEAALKALVSELGLDDCTVFTGFVAYDEVANYHNRLSISVALSNSESFGVAVIEASACEIPVVVSDVGGLPEVVENGVTGLVVPPKDVDAAATAIERLVLDADLRKTMGRAGRERVQRLYDWNANVAQMIDVYKGFLVE